MPKPVVLDDVIGGEMRCSVVNDDRQLVVVHKEDMKFFEVRAAMHPRQVGVMLCSLLTLALAFLSHPIFVQADDIGPCSALDGTKKSVFFYKNYYVVVTEETKDIPLERNTVTVYDWRDRRNKFIAFQMQVRTWTRSIDCLSCACASLACLTPASIVCCDCERPVSYRG